MHFTGTVGLGILALGLLLACTAQTAAPFSAIDPPDVLPRDRQAVVRYVALGDSTVEGVGASSVESTYVAQFAGYLRAVYPNAEVHNLGVGGATAADVVRDQVPRAVELQPQLVTLSVGPNDITRGRSLTQFEADVDRIFSTLRADPQTVLVVNLLPDLSLAPIFQGQQRELVAARTREVNEVLQRKGDEYGAVIVDLFTASQVEVPYAPEFVSADGYHPSDAGYARWAEIMWRAVEPRIAPVP